jgi:hypothetical protein
MAAGPGVWLRKAVTKKGMVPREIAGAIITPDTLQRAAKLGIDAKKYLAVF